MDTAPPEHLSDEAKDLFRSITLEHSLEPTGLKILQVALEAYDRAQAARKLIDREGMTFLDRFGQQKPHSLLATERDNRAAFLSGIKALDLGVDETSQRPGRPTYYDAQQRKR